MKQWIKLGGVVTLVTLFICYAGVRQELKIAKQLPVQSTDIKLADSNAY